MKAVVIFSAVVCPPLKKNKKMWKFYFPTMIHAKLKSASNFTDILDLWKAQPSQLPQMGEKKLCSHAGKKKATSHMSLQQGELMIYFLSMFLKHQPRSYSHIKLQMSALKGFLGELCIFPITN